MTSPRSVSRSWRRDWSARPTIRRPRSPDPGSGALAREQRRDLLRGHRPREVEALAEGASGLPKEPQLLRRLDPFRERGHAQPMRELDHRLDHPTGVLVAIDVVDEGLVDLQDVDGQVLEAGERGVAGPEVIDRQRETPRVELGEDPLRSIGVRHRRRLRDLDDHVVRVDAGTGELLHHLLRQASRPELTWREVEPDEDVDPHRLPRLPLASDLVDHPVTDRLDEPELFSDGDELPRRDDPAVG